MTHVSTCLRLAALTASLWLAACSGQDDGDVRVAAASNILPVLDVLELEFEAQTGYNLIVSTGSTGQLYAQIVHGAPYDVFLSADQARPARLVEQGFAVADSRFTYAEGRLVLWSATDGLFGVNGEAFLNEGDFRRLAIANPDLAPYGLAARETLVALAAYDRVADRLVFGENIAQTFAMIGSGNAELGFVAAAQMPETGSIWRVPADCHRPIRQDAVRLSRAADNPAAIAFLNYLQSPAAREILVTHGYGVTD